MRCGPAKALSSEAASATTAVGDPLMFLMMGLAAALDPPYKKSPPLVAHNPVDATAKAL
jgi:hypothetical protein